MIGGHGPTKLIKVLHLLHVGVCQSRTSWYLITHTHTHKHKHKHTHTHKHKHTHQDPVSRIMALSETCIIERDPATYQVVSIKPLCEVFALIRYSEDPQRFTIEYSNGHKTRYAATERYVSHP